MSCVTSGDGAVTANAVSTSQPAHGSEGSSDRAGVTYNSGAVLEIVSTSNIVGDWVRSVGGTRVEVFSLLPAGVFPHAFIPGARDVIQVTEADLIFEVGLQLEAGWLDKLIEQAAADPSLIRSLGELVEPVPFGSHSDGYGKDDSESVSVQPVLDPHFWLDPLRVVLAVKQIATSLSELDPDGAEFYTENAETYERDLVDLHQWTLDQLESISDERRKLVTVHDAFGYFAELYNFRVVTVLIPGGSTHKEPTVADLVETITVIKEEGIPVIFLETTTDSKIAELIARETDARVEKGLYVGSLGRQGSGAETYVEMFRHNVELIVTALAVQ